MNSHQDESLLNEIIQSLIADTTIETKDAFHRLKNQILAQYKKET